MTLFTVNVETSDIPAAMLLGRLSTGYGAESALFNLKAGEFDWPFDLPVETSSGRQILPGEAEMQMLIHLFDRCIMAVDVKRVVDQGLRDFAWPGHVFMDESIRVRYTVTRLKPRLGCTDVDWQCELVSADDRVACSFVKQQRWYL
jgi:hypothetical protein